MGLLSGDGGLKGLFANPDFGDSLEQADAFLNGDYGTGIGVAAKRFRRRRGSSVLDASPHEIGSVAYPPLITRELSGGPDPYAFLRPYPDPSL